jgi:hypothetical protein
VLLLQRSDPGWRTLGRSGRGQSSVAPTRSES